MFYFQDNIARSDEPSDPEGLVKRYLTCVQGSRQTTRSLSHVHITYGVGFRLTSRPPPPHVTILRADEEEKGVLVASIARHCVFTIARLSHPPIMVCASSRIPRHVPADGHAMTHLVVANLIPFPPTSQPRVVQLHDIILRLPPDPRRDRTTSWMLEFRAYELMDRNATSVGFSPEVKRATSRRTDLFPPRFLRPSARNIRKYLDGKRFPFISPDGYALASRRA